MSAIIDSVKRVLNNRGVDTSNIDPDTLAKEIEAEESALLKESQSVWDEKEKYINSTRQAIESKKELLAQALKSKEQRDAEKVEAARKASVASAVKRHAKALSKSEAEFSELENRQIAICAELERSNSQVDSAMQSRIQTYSEVREALLQAGATQEEVVAAIGDGRYRAKRTIVLSGGDSTSGLKQQIQQALSHSNSPTVFGRTDHDMVVILLDQKPGYKFP